MHQKPLLCWQPPGLFPLHSAALHAHICNIFQNCDKNRLLLKQGVSWPLKEDGYMRDVCGTVQYVQAQSKWTLLGKSSRVLWYNYCTETTSLAQGYDLDFHQMLIISIKWRFLYHFERVCLHTEFMLQKMLWVNSVQWPDSFRAQNGL